MAEEGEEFPDIALKSLVSDPVPPEEVEDDDELDYLAIDVFPAEAVEEGYLDEEDLDVDVGMGEDAAHTEAEASSFAQKDTHEIIDDEGDDGDFLDIAILPSESYDSSDYIEEEDIHIDLNLAENISRSEANESAFAQMDTHEIIDDEGDDGDFLDIAILPSESYDSADYIEEEENHEGVDVAEFASHYEASASAIARNETHQVLSDDGEMGDFLDIAIVPSDESYEDSGSLSSGPSSV